MGRQGAGAAPSALPWGLPKFFAISQDPRCLLPAIRQARLKSLPWGWLHPFFASARAQVGFLAGGASHRLRGPVSVVSGRHSRVNAGTSGWVDRGNANAEE